MAQNGYLLLSLIFLNNHLTHHFMLNIAYLAGDQSREGLKELQGIHNILYERVDHLRLLYSKVDPIQ